MSKRTRILRVGAIAFAVVLGIIMFTWRGSGPKRILRGHAKAYCTPRFSPDGAILAALCEDHTFELWDVATGKSRAIVPAMTTLVKEDARYPFYGQPEFGCAFSHDGRLFATFDGISINLWNSSTGTHIRTLDGEDLAFPSHGGSFVVRHGGNIFICDERTGEPKLEVGVSREPVRCVMRFIDDDRLLAVAAEYPRAEGTLDLMTFDTTTWALASSNVIDTAKIADFDLTLKGRLAATVVTKDALLVVCHDARSGQETRRWEVMRRKSAPDGKADDSAFEADTVILPSGMVMVKPRGGDEDFPDIVSGSLRSLWLGDLESGWCGVVEWPAWWDFREGKPALTPDGQSLVELGSERYIKGAWVKVLPTIVRGWAWKVVPSGPATRYTLTWRSVRAGGRPRTVQFTGFMESLRIAPDGKSLAGVCDDGTIHLWDAP